MSFLKQPQTCANSAPPPNRCPAASTRSASPCRGAPCGRPPHRPNVCPPRGACPSLHPLTTAVPSPCGRPSPSSQKRASNQKGQHPPRALPPQFPCPSLHRSPTNQSPSLALSSPHIPVQPPTHPPNPLNPPKSPFRQLTTVVIQVRPTLFPILTASRVVLPFTLLTPLSLFSHVSPLSPHLAAEFGRSWPSLFWGLVRGSLILFRRANFARPCQKRGIRRAQGPVELDAEHAQPGRFVKRGQWPCVCGVIGGWAQPNQSRAKVEWDRWQRALRPESRASEALRADRP